MMQEWTVTRQRPYYQNMGAEEPVYIVEVAMGDMNYTGSDMLCEKYDGEGDTYHSCVEAVEAAIRIRDQWNKDDPTVNAEVGHGNTGGGMFEIEPTDMDDDSLRDWARAYDEEHGTGDEDEEEYEEFYVVCEDCGEYLYCDDDNYGTNEEPLCGDCSDIRDGEEEEENDDQISV